MRKKALWKDIKKCVAKSKGRFFSIVGLIALGSFALVGLQITGPDMRSTGTHYFDALNVADITIIGDYGIDEGNIAAINQVSGAEAIEYGYLKDVTIEDTLTSVRIFSETETLSKYELVEGRMPEKDDEIALASFLADSYAVGQTVTFTEKEDASGNTVLKNHTFSVVGFVNSGEILSAGNLGSSTAGTGALKGYAVVTPEAFDSDVYMIARLSFTDTAGVDPYSSEYTDLIQAHKDELDALLADQPEARRAAIRSDYQAEIDAGQQEVDDAKQELADAETELADAKEELDSAQQQIANSGTQISQAYNSLMSAKSEIEAAETELAAKAEEIKTAENTLSESRTALDNGWTALAAALGASYDGTDDSKTVLINAASTAIERNPISEEQYTAAMATIAEISALQEKQNSGETLTEEEANKLSQLSSQLSDLQQRITAYETCTALQSKLTELTSGEAAYTEGATQLAEGKAEYQAAEQKIAAAKAEYETKYAEYESGYAQYQSGLAELQQGQQEYDDKLAEYEEKKPSAEQDIADAEAELDDARAELETLALPVYALDTRREIPGAEGYKVYGTVASIVDELADVFPIFLYIVAALVTLTTMTRFVDEERINSGTLKALGYDDRDITKKFVLYGLSASFIGALIGIAAGHTLMPLIVYNAYGSAFTYPKIELLFYPGISVTALLLAFLSAVVPAYLVAVRNLKDKPAALLQPKPPAAGSKILLERVTFLWRRMSFTHKVTARNIFRYKKRMLMTIFGVCGAVTMLFAGFGVQHSISGVNDRQFGEIIKYDLIVAQNNNPGDEETGELDALLSSDVVSQQMPIAYEEMTIVAGAKKDRQSIKLIVPEDKESFDQYISLVERKSGKAIGLTEDGAVLSERLAELLNVNIGDSFTLTDSENTEREMTVAAITEMYTGHFLFMSADYYETVFGEAYSANANLVTLTDRSIDNAALQASEFIKLGAVKGVVQNTTMINQVNTIVKALNKIMDVLIVVSTMLAAVIMYNLTNINVCERIREMSTIKVLGFYDKEVTMYIYRETIILTFLGILVGYGGGDLLYLYILKVVPPDEVMFNPALGAKAFLVPLLMVCVITVILGFVVHSKLKNLDMLEALKSVD